MSEKFTLNDWLGIKDSLEKAREDETPFAVHGNDGSLSVIGNANKTENKKFDYQVKFRYEKDELQAIPPNAKEVGKYVTFTIDFEDIHVNPRKDLELVESAMNIYPLIKALGEIAEDKANKVEELAKKHGVKVSRGENGQFVFENGNAQFEKDYQTLTQKANIEMVHAYNEAGDIGQDGVYKFVQILLNIDNDMADHMMPVSVLGTMYATIINNPELFNEAETVFGY